MGAPLSIRERWPEARAGLVRYFRSGWAFLLPYLALYLGYAALKWPVNPASDASVPCLLHLFWLLHGLHTGLGLLVLTLRPPASAGSPGSDMWAALPWALLGLCFLLPGVFLEFPADPWEHLSRINAWADASAVRAHDYWIKEGYFLAYSLLPAPGDRQLAWLNLYQAGACLLLCWQYYRLARAVGLAARTAWIFVLLQPVLFGNGLFSFFRYYGISSSLFAQLGAVALVRVAVELAGDPRNFRLPAFRHLLAVPGLALLIALNHVQGLGIAALGVLAVLAWGLVRWRRVMLPWLCVTLGLASLATILLYPRDPAVDALYRPQGWLAPWYGFNLFSPGSPAFARGLQILGWGGLVNLAAALWLLRRNHLAGWLTVAPILGLGLPAVALPLASALAQPHAENILTFSRFLLGIPAGLALVVALAEAAPALPADAPAGRSRFAFALLVGVLGLLVLIPPAAPGYNRFWNGVVVPPADLSLDFARRQATPSPTTAAPLVALTPRPLGFAAWAQGLRDTPYDFRARVIFPANYPTEGFVRLAAALDDRSQWHQPMMLVVPAPAVLFTPLSTTGYLSGHWSPQQVALGFAGARELREAARRAGGREVAGDGCVYFLFDLAPR